jgi:hypothetical protein
VQVYLCPSDATNNTPQENLATGLPTPPGPAISPFATSNHAANWAAFGGTGGGMRIPDSFPGGASKTIMFTERLADPFLPNTGSGVGNCWASYIAPTMNSSGGWNLPVYAPFVGYTAGGTTPDADDQGFLTQNQAASQNFPTAASTYHTGTINVCMGDASVRTVSRNYQGQPLPGYYPWFAGLTPAADVYNWDD